MHFSAKTTHQLFTQTTHHRTRLAVVGGAFFYPRTRPGHKKVRFFDSPTLPTHGHTSCHALTSASLTAPLHVNAASPPVLAPCYRQLTMTFFSSTTLSRLRRDRMVQNPRSHTAHLPTRFHAIPTTQFRITSPFHRLIVPTSPKKPQARASISPSTSKLDRSSRISARTPSCALDLRL